MEFLMCLWLRCHTRIVVLGASLQLSVPRFFAFSQWFCFSLVYFRVLPSVTGASLCVPPARGRPHVLPFTRKGCVGDVPRCCLEIHRRAP